MRLSLRELLWSEADRFHKAASPVVESTMCLKGPCVVEGKKAGLGVQLGGCSFQHGFQLGGEKVAAPTSSWIFRAWNWGKEME